MRETPNPSEASQQLSASLSRQRASITRYLVLAGLCVASMIAYISRNCLGLAEQPISQELNIKLVPMGWVMGTFFWTYALAQIPAGWLGHVWGPRKALAIYAVVWSLACLAMGQAIGFWTLIAAQLLFGIGQAGLFPCAAAVISRWITGMRRAIASGFLGGSQSFGAAVGSALTAVLLNGVPGFWWDDIYVKIDVVQLSWRGPVSSGRSAFSSGFEIDQQITGASTARNSPCLNQQAKPSPPKRKPPHQLPGAASSQALTCG